MQHFNPFIEDLSCECFLYDKPVEIKTGEKWARSVLVTVCTRLGLKSIDSQYYQAIK